MTRFVGAALVAALILGSARADADKDSQAIVDKAVKALGGAEKLGAVKAMTWTTKGTLSLGGADNEFTSRNTVQGLDKFRGEFEGDFGGNKIMGVNVVNGDKGWRSFAGMTMDLDKDGLANQKRGVYLQVIPTTLVALQGKDFKVQAAGEEKVDGKPALGVKVTPPDGKEFTLFFDKESGLPVKQVAKVLGFTGDEYTQETTFGGYKDMDGIKKATKIESKRDGEKLLQYEVTEFKVVKEVDAKTFDEPK